MTNTKRLKKTFLILTLIGLIGLPIVLLSLPATYFDEGESICLSQTLFHQTCYGCGITRAVQHLLHGDLDIALNYNKLAAIVLPVLVFLWGQNIWLLFKKISKINTTENRIK